MNYLMLEMNVGHCLAHWASRLVGKLWFRLPFTWWLFGLLVFKRALLKQITPQRIFFPLLSYCIHSISH